MSPLQLLFTLLVILLLACLLVEGWFTRAVWVKGRRDGLFSFRNWAHKCERDEEAWRYWFAMSFYAVALACLCVLVLSE